jgi:hypothetical protein
MMISCVVVFSSEEMDLRIEKRGGRHVKGDVSQEARREGAAGYSFGCIGSERQVVWIWRDWSQGTERAAER